MLRIAPEGSLNRYAQLARAVIDLSDKLDDAVKVADRLAHLDSSSEYNTPFSPDEWRVVAVIRREMRALLAKLKGEDREKVSES